MRIYVGKKFAKYLEDGRDSLDNFKMFSKEELLNSTIVDFKRIEKDSFFIECLLLHLDDNIYSIIVNYNNGSNIENKDANACWSYEYSKKKFEIYVNKYTYENNINEEEDAWSSQNLKLLIKAYEESPNPDILKNAEIKEILQIFIDNNIQYEGDNIENNDIVNIARNLVEVPNPEIKINNISKIERIGYPDFMDNYDLFGWFADTGDEFYIITINNKKHLALMEDGFYIVTLEKAILYIDDMIKAGYIEKNDPDIPKIKSEFIEYVKNFSC